MGFPSCSYGEAALKPLVLLQLELQSQEMLAKHWRHLAKKEAKAAKAAKESGTAHVPAAETPEATFLPRLLSDFLQVCMPMRGIITCSIRCTQLCPITVQLIGALPHGTATFHDTAVEDPLSWSAICDSTQ